jgi:DNA helicase II / ATP-dependent DNA helicase PcrA
MSLTSANLIVGPPGTGKTTKLLSIVDTSIQEGIKPEEICFVAFTRKAAHEAKHRAMEKFNLADDQLPWFRTLHSLAFQQVGSTSGSIMRIQDYFALARILGLHLTIKGIQEDGTISGLSKGDRLFFMVNQARNMMKPLKTYWEERPDEDIYWYELEQVANTIDKYKLENGKRDFTDVIDEFVKTGNVPKLRMLIVDEAQDLSLLQWSMVDKLAEHAEQVYIAGDDDQAIFRWAGADVEKFMTLDGFQMVLPQSYRVPVAVQEVANRVISRCQTRIPKAWKPRGEQGLVRYVNSVDEVNMDEGSWLLLGRNSYLLETYNNYCTQMGYMFDSSIGGAVSGKIRQSLYFWEKLLAGGQITIAQARIVYDFMSIRERVAYGSKSKLDRAQDSYQVGIIDLEREYGLLCAGRPWHEALDKLSEMEKQYFLAALARGEKLTDTPRIKISTIHSVKGGEADHVVLQTDMAWRTFKEFESNPDDEHRVWYVGVTRARQSLTIIQPTSDKSYDL